MGDRSLIEWTDATWNPVTGCTKVSKGCKHCYAERLWNRLSTNPSAKSYFGRDFTDVSCHAERLDQPMRWSRPRKVFVNSMSDLFHPDVPMEFIEQVFISMARCPQHTFQLLTKRPERMLEYMDRVARSGHLGLGKRGWPWGETAWPLPNVWMGASAEDQPSFDGRWAVLKLVPAAVRWVSLEPLLGAINLPQSVAGGSQLQWVVVGGESGPKARQMDPMWARALRDQCQAFGIDFFFKQWGAKRAKDESADIDDGGLSDRGQRVAGRLLDGRTWNAMPRPEHRPCDAHLQEVS